MMSEEENQREKKLRGSGGFVYAKVTDAEQKKGNLGGPELFLAGIGRLPEERFSKYFCNKCEKEYRGSPLIKYENLNEDLGEGVILAEKGEYKCATCNSTIAQYRKFDPSSISSHGAVGPQSNVTSNSGDEKIVDGIEGNQIIQRTSESMKASSIESQTDTGFLSIQSLVGMPAYNSEALLIGKVKEIGLRRPIGSGNTQISIKIIQDDYNMNERGDNTEDIKTANPTTVEILWNEISKIGDIVLINRASSDNQTSDTTKSISTGLEIGKCSSCGHLNERDASFCEECGKKL
jgi:sporulation protein YlmC with PRC-barrel domain/DNA-directed RNA polymerase subunit RPC12/RpoP